MTAIVQLGWGLASRLTVASGYSWGGGSNISGEIYYPSIKQCVDLRGDKIFQDGPNISEIFVPGSLNISAKLK